MRRPKPAQRNCLFSVSSTRVSYLPLSHVVSAASGYPANRVIPYAICSITAGNSRNRSELHSRCRTPAISQTRMATNRLPTLPLGTEAAEQSFSNVLAKMDRRPLLHLSASRHSGVGVSIDRIQASICLRCNILGAISTILHNHNRSSRVRDCHLSLLCGFLQCWCCRQVGWGSPVSGTGSLSFSASLSPSTWVVTASGLSDAPVVWVGSPSVWPVLFCFAVVVVVAVACDR